MDGSNKGSNSGARKISPAPSQSGLRNLTQQAQSKSSPTSSFQNLEEPGRTSVINDNQIHHTSTTSPEIRTTPSVALSQSTLAQLPQPLPLVSSNVIQHHRISSSPLLSSSGEEKGRTTKETNEIISAMAMQIRILEDANRARVNMERMNPLPLYKNIPFAGNRKGNTPTQSARKRPRQEKHVPQSTIYANDTGTHTEDDTSTERSCHRQVTPIGGMADCESEGGFNSNVSWYCHSDSGCSAAQSHRGRSPIVRKKGNRIGDFVKLKETKPGEILKANTATNQNGHQQDRRDQGQKGTRKYVSMGTAKLYLDQFAIGEKSVAPEVLLRKLKQNVYVALERDVDPSLISMRIIRELGTYSFTRSMFYDMTPLTSLDKVMKTAEGLLTHSSCVFDPQADLIVTLLNDKRKEKTSVLDFIIGWQKKREVYVGAGGTLLTKHLNKLFVNLVGIPLDDQKRIDMVIKRKTSLGQVQRMLVTTCGQYSGPWCERHVTNGGKRYKSAYLTGQRTPPSSDNGEVNASADTNNVQEKVQKLLSQACQALVTQSTNTDAGRQPADSNGSAKPKPTFCKFRNKCLKILSGKTCEFKHNKFDWRYMQEKRERGKREKCTDLNKIRDYKIESFEEKARQFAKENPRKSGS